ncbi:MAG: NAD-dependent epimerase/dehydratase family protein [Proteobacteria bacterium]|nr:NAD-dependent epimerase/dehydratase family protein [Pseudomonadota bacterium]
MAEAKNRGPVRLDVPFPASVSGMEQESARPTADLGNCLVTGGAGFLGRHIAFELARRGHPVRVFDRQPLETSHEGIEFVQGDITCFEDVRKACEGIDTVFHTAAVLCFVSLPTRAEREESTAVNVTGVENAVRAAREAGVARLIHTSTNNVTLDRPVIDGDESLPYAARARDLYTETKIRGEQIALAANGEGGLLTCAIRPGGIWGPGEKVLFPRVVDECASGRYIATIGDGSAMSDNTFIDNLVDGEIEAARHLLPESPLGGQAYFITDGVPINYFDLFRPIIEGLGFRHPRLRLPAGLMEGVAMAWEFLHRRIGFPRPMLLPLEVRKITLSHYNRIDKARRDFGWVPVVGMDEAQARCLEYCRTLLANRESVDRPHWGWWVAILGGMTLTGVLALSPAAHAAWSEAVTVWTPRWLLGTIFVWAVLVHVHKGMVAVRLAERAGLHATSTAWGWQTFALGFASLRLLRRRAEANGD